MDGRNTIMSHYYYRVNTNIGNVVCSICQIYCQFPASVPKIDKYWFVKLWALFPAIYKCIEHCYCKNYLGMTMNDFMEFLDNNNVQKELDNIHALVLYSMTTNKAAFC